MATHATNHIAHVLFGQFVVGQIGGLKTFFAEFFSDFARFACIVYRDTDHNVRLCFVIHAVVKFGHTALLTDQFAQTQERATFFGNAHRKQGFTRLTNFHTIRDKAQTVKIGVRTRSDGDEVLSF